MAIALIVPAALGGPRTSARAELLRSSLTSELGREVEVRIAANYAELRDALLSGSVELAWTPAAILAELPEARVVLRSVRGGRATYCSAIITRSEGGVSVARLNKTRAAWVDPLSIGGHLLALSWLRARGIDSNLIFSSQTFLGSHRAVIDAVIDGSADLGAVSTPSAEQTSQSIAFYAGGTANKLAIVGVTDSAPTDALVISTKLSEHDAERIAQCLAPTKGRRSPSFLLSAMEAERLERTTLDDYRALRSLTWRKSERPPPPSRR